MQLPSVQIICSVSNRSGFLAGKSSPSVRCRDTGSGIRALLECIMSGGGDAAMRFSVCVTLLGYGLRLTTAELSSSRARRCFFGNPIAPAVPSSFSNARMERALRPCTAASLPTTKMSRPPLYPATGVSVPTPEVSAEAGACCGIRARWCM